MTEQKGIQSQQQVGRKVISNGIVAAFHHYVQAIQLQENMTLKDALGEAVKLCDGIKVLLQEELKNTK